MISSENRFSLFEIMRVPGMDGRGGGKSAFLVVATLKAFPASLRESRIGPRAMRGLSHGGENAVLVKESHKALQ